MCRLLTFGDRSTFASLFPGLVGAVDRRVDGGHQATRLHYRDEQRVRHQQARMQVKADQRLPGAGLPLPECASMRGV